MPPHIAYNWVKAKGLGMPELWGITHSAVLVQLRLARRALTHIYQQRLYLHCISKLAVMQIKTISVLSASGRRQYVSLNVLDEGSTENCLGYWLHRERLWGHIYISFLCNAFRCFSASGKAQEAVWTNISLTRHPFYPPMSCAVISLYLLVAKVSQEELHSGVIKPLLNIKHVDRVTLLQELLHHVLA